MTLIKSFAVGNGDMFYIQHNSDNFTIIDCNLPDDRADGILADVEAAKKGKGITRFISTHPDQDHIAGLVKLDNRFDLLNFYVVKNKATKAEETEDFKRYKFLRDHEKKAFYVERGCKRKWMNESNEERGSSGLNIRWPVLTNHEFKKALQEAECDGNPNNISPVIRYSVEDGASVMWMGDLETCFMENIADAFTPESAHILFAPHHGRDSGRVPGAWLDAIAPRIIVVGEAPADDLCYYAGCDTITQNSAGDITFDCITGKVRVYVSEPDYQVDCLTFESGVPDAHGGYYIGTLVL
ncbi:MAG: MBL fold metallo-hydrolase [Gemmatimonadales bacterium]